MTSETDYEQSEIPESRAAIWPGFVALLLGAVSSVALRNQLLWFVPVVAATFSAIAIWRAGGKSGSMVVRWLAAVGMLASLFFGTLGPARHISRTRYLEQQSVDFGREWIDLLQQGRIKEAHQLCMPPERRATDMKLMEDLYKTTAKIAELYRTFESDPLVKQIIDIGQRGVVRYDGVENAEVLPDLDVVHQNYTISSSPGSNAREVSMTVSLRRLRPSASGTSHWEISDFRQRDAN
jgi:hypothetical protein